MNNVARHRGFTLLELVLVMVIIALALAAVAPKLGAWSRGRQVRDAGQQFIALTRFARSQAICDGTIYRLTISSQTRSYQLSKQDGQNFVPVPSDLGEAFPL